MEAEVAQRRFAQQPRAGQCRAQLGRQRRAAGHGRQRRGGQRQQHLTSMEVGHVQLRCSVNCTTSVLPVSKAASQYAR